MTRSAEHVIGEDGKEVVRPIDRDKLVSLRGPVDPQTMAASLQAAYGERMQPCTVIDPLVEAGPDDA